MPLPVGVFQMRQNRSRARAGAAPQFKLWISVPKAQGVFGDGKWRLLDAIEQCGSLRAAAETLGISYRKAWGDLGKAEKYLKVRFIDKQRGGSGGGESHLTDLGRRWVAAYRRFRSDIEAATQKSFDKHIAPLLQEKQ